MQAFTNFCTYIFVHIFIVFLLHSNASGQTTNNINLHLERFSNEYRLGTSVLVMGMVCTGVGYLLNEKADPPGSAKPFIAIGLTVCSIGITLHIDSHKHLNPHRVTKQLTTVN